METSALAAGLLDAASVLVDVFFTVVVGVAVMVAVDLVRRWSRAVSARKVQQQDDEEEPRDPVPVTSWRPGAEPPSVALPPARPRTSGGTYGGRAIGQRFPEDPGRLL